MRAGQARAREAPGSPADATQSLAIASICATCSSTELTLRLRELGINARGSKRELAQRLIERDPRGAGLHVRRRLPDNVRREMAGVADDLVLRHTTRTTLECLRRRDIDAAIECAADSRSVDAARSPRTQASGERAELRHSLRWILTTWPPALAEVPNAARSAYRTAAAMMALHDSACAPEWIDVKGPTRLRLTGTQIARVLLQAAQHEMRRRRWRAAGITHAKIVFAGAPCTACHTVAGKVCNLRALPVLPAPACTCEGGCAWHLLAYRLPRGGESRVRRAALCDVPAPHSRRSLTDLERG